MQLGATNRHGYWRSRDRLSSIHFRDTLATAEQVAAGWKKMWGDGPES
jgi:hypothetical protein